MRKANGSSGMGRRCAIAATVGKEDESRVRLRSKTAWSVIDCAGERHGSGMDG